MRAMAPTPTHYTRALDPDSGAPIACCAENYSAKEIAGKLPADWHPDFFDWQPRGVAKGKWVELADKRRDALWASVKTQRAADQVANVEVSIGGRALLFQADQASFDLLLGEKAAADVDPDWQPVDWTTAGNAGVTLDKSALGMVIAAIIRQRRAVHAASQAARARIFDTGKPLLRDLGALTTK